MSFADDIRDFTSSMGGTPQSSGFASDVRDFVNSLGDVKPPEPIPPSQPGGVTYEERMAGGKSGFLENVASVLPPVALYQATDPQRIGSERTIGEGALLQFTEPFTKLPQSIVGLGKAAGASVGIPTEGIPSPRAPVEQMFEMSPSAKKARIFDEDGSLSGSAFSPENWRFWWEHGINVASRMERDIALAVATGGGPTTFAAVAGSTVAGEHFDEAFDRISRQHPDWTDMQKRRAAGDESLMIGAMTGLTERIPGGVIFSRVPGADKVVGEGIKKGVQRVLNSAGGRITKATLAEGVQEIVQEASTDLIKHVRSEDPEAFRDWQNRYATSGAFGAIAGGGMATVTSPGGIEQPGPPPEFVPEQRATVQPEYSEGAAWALENPEKAATLAQNWGNRKKFEQLTGIEGLNRKERAAFAGEVAGQLSGQQVGQQPSPTPPVAPEPQAEQPTARQQERAEGGAIDLGAIGEKTVGTYKRWLTAAGDLPQPAFDAKIARDGWLDSWQKRVRFTRRDYRAATKGATPETVDKMNRMLHGEPADMSLTPEQVNVVERMRQEIDQLSRHLIDIGAVEGELVGVIEANEGQYVRRSYRAFDDPNWAKSVPEDIRNKAKALLRSEYAEQTVDLTEAEREDFLEGKIRNLLYEGKAAESPIALLKSSKLGQKDLSILKRRLGIPPELRALLGEYTDPIVNYSRSVANMTQLAANHTFLETVKDEGLGSFLFEQPRSTDYVRISAEGNPTMQPLDGLYTTPEIKKAFEQAFSKEGRPNWLAWYMRANGAVKLSKTVLSPVTQVRNFISNVGFAVANGHWRAMNGKKMLDVLRNELGLGEGNKPLKGRQYVLRLRELGLIGEDIRAGELRDILRDANIHDIDALIGSAVSRAARGGLRAVTDLYQLSDAIWKVYAFENEKARYSQAFPEWTKDQLERHSAQIVRNTYPTYSQVPEVVKLLRRLPFMGTFVSWPAEIIRTSANTLHQAASELRNPTTRAIGAERVAGILMASTAPFALAMVMRFLSGVSKDEEDDLREFVAPWNENSQLGMLGKTPSGNYRIIDLSYSDPYAYLRKPAMALLRGQDWTEALGDMAKELGDPFFGEEILYGKILDVARNQKREGGEVFNPAASTVEQTKAIVLHIGDAFEPGAVTTGGRILKAATGTQSEGGRVYDLTDEVRAAATGQRVVSVDPAQSLSFDAREYAQQLLDSKRLLTKVANRRGAVGDSELQGAYESMNEARKAAFDAMHRKAQAAIRLGIDSARVEAIIKGASLSTSDTEAVVTGDYSPYLPTENFLGGMAASTGQGEEYSRRRALVQQAAVAASDDPQLAQATLDEQTTSAVLAKAKSLARAKPKDKEKVADWETEQRKARLWLQERNVPVEQIQQVYGEYLKTLKTPGVRGANRRRLRKALSQ